jgi:hypothetical protein
MPDIKRWVKLITHQKPMYVPHAPSRALHAHNNPVADSAC